MSKYGKCVSCYFFTKYYCSLRDIDVDKTNGCRQHKTIDEIRHEKEY